MLCLWNFFLENPRLNDTSQVESFLDLMKFIVHVKRDSIFYFMYFKYALNCFWFDVCFHQFRKESNLLLEEFDVLQYIHDTELEFCLFFIDENSCKSPTLFQCIKC